MVTNKMIGCSFSHEAMMSETDTEILYDVFNLCQTCGILSPDDGLLEPYHFLVL